MKARPPLQAGEHREAQGRLAGRVVGLAGDIGDPSFTTGNGGVGNDFALIRIDPAFYAFVEPTMCRWGGPQGVQTARDTSPVYHVGWGVYWGEDPTTRGRAALIQAGGFAPSSVSFRAAAGPGDSGSPIMMDDGKALGVLTHGSAGGEPWFGTIWGSRVDAMLARANQGGRGYALVDSPIPPDPTGLTVPE